MKCKDIPVPGIKELTKKRITSIVASLKNSLPGNNFQSMTQMTKYLTRLYIFAPLSHQA
jgi:hypothetical protein